MDGETFQKRLFDAFRILVKRGLVAHTEVLFFHRDMDTVSLMNGNGDINNWPDDFGIDFELELLGIKQEKIH